MLANLFADFRTAQIAEPADIHWFSADTFHAAQLDHASSSREPTLRMPISGRFHRDEAIKLIRENGTLHVNVFLYIFDKRILGDLRFLSHNCHEDHAFTALLLARAATVRCSEISYVHKRVRPNSVMTSKHGQYNADSYLACADAIAKDYAAQKASANRSYPYEFLRQRISLTLLCGRSLWRESNMGFVLRLFRSETFVLRMGVPLFTRRVLNRFRAPGQRRWGGASQST